MRLTLLLLLLAAPLSAQTLATTTAPPVGYWSLNTDAYDAEGQPLEVVVVVRFKPDGTFAAVLKTRGRDGEIGSSSPFRGEWERQTVFGQPMVCIKRPEMAGGVCQYAIVNGGLVYANRHLSPHSEAEVRVIAPELTQ